MDRLRTPDTTPLLLSTHQGLEDVAAQEADERAESSGISEAAVQTCPDGMTGYVWFEGRASLDEMLKTARRMRSIQHILAPVYAFDLPAIGGGEAMRSVQDMLASMDVPEMADASSFRVTTNRRGNHAFTSMDVMRAAGAGLVDRYGTDVDLEDYDLEVRVDVRHQQVLVSVQYTDEPLSRRQARVFQPPAALSPSVAYAMLRLPYFTSPPGRVVDPFCGSGTIPIEAAHVWPDASVVGIDRDPDVVEGARRNLTSEALDELVFVRFGDALELPEHLDETPDLVVTNPPFGHRLGTGLDLFTFYKRMLAAVHRTLEPDGWFVVLVLKPGVLSGALQEVAVAFDVRHVRRVHLGGLHPRIFVMQRGA